MAPASGSHGGQYRDSWNRRKSSIFFVPMSLWQAPGGPGCSSEQVLNPTGPGPFSIKPLLVAVASGAEPMMSIALERDLSTIPGGKATF